MALRKDLRPDQDLDVARVNTAPHGLPRVARTHAVAIDAQYTRLGVTLRQRVFHALCALPQRRELGVAAVRTGGRYGCDVPAMVTAQLPLPEVQHQLSGATMAPGDPAATVAHEHGRVPTPVNENEALFASCQILVERLQQTT